jgi:hypothetical protein
MSIIEAAGHWLRRLFCVRVTAGARGGQRRKLVSLVQAVRIAASLSLIRV